MRNVKSFAVALSGCLLLCTIAGADDQKAADQKAADTAAAAADQKNQVSIPFANHGGIYNWEVQSDHSVLIQDRSRKWYRATLLGSCFDLRFAERVGFMTNPGGSFDRFSQILVRGQRCPLISLVPSPGPVKKSKTPKSAAPITPQPAG